MQKRFSLGSVHVQRSAICPGHATAIRPGAQDYHKPQVPSPSGSFPPPVFPTPLPLLFLHHGPPGKLGSRHRSQR